jgi:hypothetical protein
MFSMYAVFLAPANTAAQTEAVSALGSDSVTRAHRSEMATGDHHCSNAVRTPSGSIHDPARFADDGPRVAHRLLREVRARLCSISALVSSTICHSRFVPPIAGPPDTLNVKPSSRDAGLTGTRRVLRGFPRRMGAKD